MPTRDRQGKWQPFDAVPGYQEALQQAETKQSWEKCPTLSEDEIEEINIILQRGLLEKIPLRITYYQKGFFYDIEGLIQMISPLIGKIIINGCPIRLTSIYRVEERSLSNEKNNCDSNPYC